MPNLKFKLLSQHNPKIRVSKGLLAMLLILIKFYVFTSFCITLITFLSQVF